MADDQDDPEAHMRAFDRHLREAAAFVALEDHDWPPAMRALVDALDTAVEQARRDGATRSEVRAAVAELAARVGGDSHAFMREAIATAQAKWYARVHPDADEETA